MRPDQIELVAASWEAVAGRREEIARVFYDLLFRRNPDFRALFAHSDMATQYSKFVGMVDAIIGLRGDAREVVRAAVALGQRHAHYGVVREQYAPAGAALLAALERVLGPGLTPELRNAWAEAYSVISVIMCRGAEQMDNRRGAA
jgi:hemoglobin-like flavoprotein